jgi:16S rRNA (guanine527-N7)-methyltransferase
MTSPVLSLPAPPDAATAVFGERLPLAVRYAELLAGPGVERGLIGPRETVRLWERHLLNCAGLASLLAAGEHVLDLGSGAGLPGLVLGVLRDDVRIELVEPLLRRSTFLTEVVEALGLAHVSVRRARGEELAGKVAADVVTARAVAPLDRLTAWSMPLLRAGGRLLALKGEQADDELAQTRPSLRKAGAESAQVVRVGSAENMTQARVVVVVRGPGAVDRRRAERR